MAMTGLLPHSRQGSLAEVEQAQGDFQSSELMYAK